MRGRYRDTVRGAAGRPVLDTGWRSNTIVDPAWRLLAGLLKNDRDLDGILYWAVGAGEPAWDDAPPAADPSAARLHAEVGRVRVAATDIDYLDADDRPTGEPSDRLELRARFEWPQRETTLREFGIFGGDATREADSGYLINHVVHPRLDVAAGGSLDRRLRLGFRPGAAARPGAPGPLPRHWLGDAPVTAIGGVGDAYASALSGAGVGTVEDLAQVEPVRLEDVVSVIRASELRAKARLALRTAARLRAPAGLHARTVWDVLVTPTATLAADAGAEEAETARLRNDASMLELALDNRMLRGLTVGELVARP